MTSVRLMKASKLTPQKAVSPGHKSFVSEAALLKNAPKASVSCFYHCPHHQSTWGPSSLVLSKMTNMSHLIHSLFSRGELRCSKLLSQSFSFLYLCCCIWEGKQGETPLMQRGKKDKLFVMVSSFCEGYSRASAWLVIGSGNKRS